MVKSRNGRRLKGASPLAALRIAKGLSQPDAAHRMGMSPTNLSQLERGLHMPQVWGIEALAALYEVDANTIIAALSRKSA